MPTEPSEYRCLGFRKEHKCSKLLFKAYDEPDAVIVEIKCDSCKTFLVRKFRTRRVKTWQTLSL
jgi:phage FluMu protein Com